MHYEEGCETMEWAQDHAVQTTKSQMPKRLVEFLMMDRFLKVIERLVAGYCRIATQPT